MPNINTIDFFQDSWVKNVHSNYEDIVVFKIQMFQFGLIILKSAIGCYELLSTDIFNYVCPHATKINTNNTIKSSCCCLMHCIEKYENSSNIKSIKISNFISEKRYTKSFVDFLCLLLSYNMQEYNIGLIRSHKWLKLESLKSNVSVNLCETISLIKSLKIKTSTTIDEFVRSFQIFSTTNPEIEVDVDLREISSVLRIDLEELKTKIEMSK